jgi:hypothetical protein
VSVTTSNEFSDAFSTAFDAQAGPVPSVPWVRNCCAWEADLGCITTDEWDAFDPEVQDRALDLAWETLRHLTGGRVSKCSVLARPCKAACLNSSYAYGYNGYGGLVPVVIGGQWLNLACGCGLPMGCGCTEVCEVTFPGPVAKVSHVWLDGVELDPVAYRLDNFNRLVRVDGACWPICQDIGAPWDQPGAFAVEYVPGLHPGGSGAWMAGILAGEWAKACTGGKCRLPSTVVNVSRQGVTMDFSEGMFPGGVTGIREVDAWVLSVNPNHLAQPARVWSPDLRQPRYQT